MGKGFIFVIVVLVIVVVILGICCWKKNGGQPGALKCRWVAIAYDKGSEECDVRPEQRHMEADEKVTFINLTDEKVTIEFISSSAILEPNPFTIGQNDSKTVTLKQPGVEATFEYKVTAGCYTTPLGGPRVVIP